MRVVNSFYRGDTQVNNNTNTRDVVHFREKVKVVYAMNKFKNNRNRKGGEGGPDGNGGTDYNHNEDGGEDIDDNHMDDAGNDFGKRKGPFAIPMKRMPRNGSKDTLSSRDYDPAGDPEQRGNSERGKPRGGAFKGAGKAAATLAALKARAKKNNNTVSPLNFDDEGYYEDDDDGDNNGNVTTRDIRLSNKYPGKNSNPDFERTNPRAAASVPVLDKRFNRNVSGVDLYIQDEDYPDNSDNFKHPPPAPRFHLGDDASVDMPYAAQGASASGGFPFGGEGDDAAFF